MNIMTNKKESIVRTVLVLKVILLLSIASCTAQQSKHQTVLNLGIGDDKYMHFAAGTGVSMLAGCLFHDATRDLNRSIKFAAASGIGAGLFKELYDTRRGGSGFNTPDLLFTAAGAVLGTYLTHIINKPRKRR